MVTAVMMASYYLWVLLILVVKTDSLIVSFTPNELIRGHGSRILNIILSYFIIDEENISRVSSLSSFDEYNFKVHLFHLPQSEERQNVLRPCFRDRKLQTSLFSAILVLNNPTIAHEILLPQNDYDGNFLSVEVERFQRGYWFEDLGLMRSIMLHAIGNVSRMETPYLFREFLGRCGAEDARWLFTELTPTLTPTISLTFLPSIYNIYWGHISGGLKNHNHMNLIMEYLEDDHGDKILKSLLIYLGLFRLLDHHHKLFEPHVKFRTLATNNLRSRFPSVKDDMLQDEAVWSEFYQYFILEIEKPTMVLGASFWSTFASAILEMHHIEGISDGLLLQRSKVLMENLEGIPPYYRWQVVRLVNQLGVHPMGSPLNHRFASCEPIEVRLKAWKFAGPFVVLSKNHENLDQVTLEAIVELGANFCVLPLNMILIDPETEEQVRFINVIISAAEQVLKTKRWESDKTYGDVGMLFYSWSFLILEGRKLDMKSIFPSQEVADDLNWKTFYDWILRLTGFDLTRLLNLWQIPAYFTIQEVRRLIDLSYA